MQLRKLNGIFSKSNLPDSILEKSKISLIIANNVSLLLRIVSTKSNCRGVKSISSKSPLIPITAFMGVRIS